MKHILISTNPPLSQVLDQQELLAIHITDNPKLNPIKNNDLVFDLQILVWLDMILFIVILNSIMNLSQVGSTDQFTVSKTGTVDLLRHL